MLMYANILTKRFLYEFLSQKLQSAGCQVVLIDAGILGAPLTQPDISREEEVPISSLGQPSAISNFRPGSNSPHPTKCSFENTI